MENQTKPKPLGASMAKLVLVVAIIVFLGAVIGVVEYVTKKERVILEIPKKTGIIEGSLSYPSEFIPPDMKVCAENSETKKEYCTNKQENDSKYKYGKGYKIEVPAGKYYVFATTQLLSGYKAYYSEFVTCGLNVNCSSHSPIIVIVKAGQTVTNIDPWDWYKLSEEIVADETADWKTYRNEEYGYEVKYPEDWMLDEGQKEAVTINSPENEKLHKKIESGEVYGEGYMRDITIIYYNSIPGGTFDEFVKRELISSLNPVNFAGQNAYEAIMGHFGAYHSILIEKNNHLYIIQFGNREDKSKLTKTDNQILSTFKFIEKDETADWKTYRNEEYGFEIKYPAIEGARIKENVATNGRFKDKVYYTEITTLAAGQSFSEIEKDGFRIVLGVGDYSFRPCIFIDEYTKLISEIEKINLQAIEFEKAKIKSEGWKGYNVQFCGVKNGITYEVSIFDYNSFHNQPSSLIDQILSTFKFMELTH